MSSLLAVALAFAAPPAAVTLGPAEPLPASLHGFNTYFLMATAFQGMTYDGPQFENAVRTLRPRNLRFPGGTIANNYLWREDSFSEPTADKTGWAGEQLRLFRKLGKKSGLAGFARICKRYDIEPVWVLNVYEETPESVAPCSTGWTSWGWTCGGWSSATSRIGTAAASTTCENTPPPAAPSPWPCGQKSAGGADRGLLRAARAKATTISRIGTCRWARRTGTTPPSSTTTTAGRGSRWRPGRSCPPSRCCGRRRWWTDAVAALDAAAPGKPVWFTEWNLGSEGIGQWKNTGAELLFLAGVFDRLVARRDRIELACFHNIYESNFGAFYLDQETGEVRTNASWEFFRLLGTAFADATELRPVSVAAAGDDLYGFAAADGGDVRLMLVNRGETRTGPSRCPPTCRRTPSG